MEFFSEHKLACKYVSESSKRVKVLGKELKRMRPLRGDEAQDLFEMIPGRFWSVSEIRDYMTERNKLACGLRSVASRFETKSLWNAVLKHQLDMLWLCKLDNLGIRDDVPSTFLALNLDDDCYRFIKFWLLRFDVEEYELDWDEDTTTYRYGDPTEDHEDTHISLAHTVALSVVKMRIVAAYEAHVKIVQEVLPFDDLVRENIVKMIVCCDIDRQKSLRKKYLCMVHKRNKHMLPAFANPRPMMKVPFPKFGYRPGDMNEARMHMDTYCRHVLRVPGAQDCIKDFLKESS